MGAVGGASEQDFDELNWGARFCSFCYCTYLVEKVSGAPCELNKDLGAYFKKLLLNFWPGATPYVFKDLVGIFESSDRSQVARGIGQKLDACQQEECWETLKCEEKAPSHSRHAVVDERQTKVFN